MAHTELSLLCWIRVIQLLQLQEVDCCFQMWWIWTLLSSMCHLGLKGGIKHLVVLSHHSPSVAVPHPLGSRAGIWPWRGASEWWEHSARSSVTCILLSICLIEVWRLLLPIFFSRCQGSWMVEAFRDFCHNFILCQTAAKKRWQWL